MNKELLDLIILPFHDYKKWKSEGFRTRDAHLFQHFKNNEKINKILVINRPVSLAERIIKRKSWKTKLGKVIVEKKNYQLCQTEENVYYVDFKKNDFFSVILLRKLWWDRVFKNEKIIKIINEIVEYLNMTNKIILLQNPMAIGVVRKLQAKKFVFDAIDNWLYHPQMKGYSKTLKENYKFIEENADIIFTVSKSLKEMFENTKDVFWLPNGVDKGKFSIQHESNLQKVNATIGYIGKIQDRVDFNLIEKCVKKYQNNNFLIIGPIYSQKDKVRYLQKMYTNIKFLGDVSYESLPEIMEQFDIAIIPHKVNKFTNSMNPLKIYEYLAAGKQIVATKVAGTNISEYIYLAADDNEFISLINKAINSLKEDEDIEKKVRNSLEDSNTWEKISEKMIDIIEEKI